MDADDVCLPGRFSAQMQYFVGRGDLGVLGGHIELIDANGQPLRLVTYPAKGGELKAFLAKGSPVAHPAVMLRKAAVEQVGGYRRAFRHAEDYDLWLRLDEAGYAIENVQLALVGYRQHAENVSVVHRRHQAIATLAAQCAHRARLAGVSDPTAGLDSLDERIFELFPAELLTDLRDQLFWLHVDTISFDTEQQLLRALAAFEQVPTDLQRTGGAMRFLLYTARGAVRLRLYSLALGAISRAFALAPTEVGAIVARKARGVLRGSTREAAHWGRLPTSERSPVE
jgi:hypothetical protein